MSFAPSTVMRAATWFVLWIVLATAGASPARAADCSAGPGDVDGDGMCDALDPCPAGGVAARETTLTLRKLGGRPDDDTLRFRGVIPLDDDAAIDPAVTGMRLLAFDGAWTADDVVVDLAAPAGSDWMSAGNGRSWSYRASDPLTAAIKRAVVKDVAPNPAYDRPRALAVSIDARRGSYGDTTDLDAHLVLVAFAATGAAETCAEARFLPWIAGWPRAPEPWETPPWQASCRHRGSPRTLLCTTGETAGPCRVGMPDDQLRCDAQQAAEAQQQVWNATGTYFTGECTALPGFIPSPAVTCVTSGDAARFIVLVDHPGAAAGGCIWDNYAVPKLTCS